ncbi:MAG: restriction endonuclease subunit S [Proteobacteria bacterium]|nr:restriction endonuclease subunit S [Pseudomonadota bacterium]
MRSKIPIAIEDKETYSRVTIRTKHQGVSKRDDEVGKKIGTKKQFLLKSGQFVMSKIDARYGAFGIADQDVHDAIITGNFWAYDINQELTTVEWIERYTNSSSFYDLCERASSGITHRKYLDEKVFIAHELYIPPKEDQSNILLKLEKEQNSLNELATENQNQSSYLTKLRQAILQEAIEGKLTADWRKENPVRKGDLDFDAGALLEKIKAEKEKLFKEGKIKKEKFQESILEHELEIPSAWTLPMLGEISKQITDGTHQTPTYTTAGEIFLSAQNVKPFRFMPENYKLISEKAFHEYRKNKIPEIGDLLIGRVGAGIGETAVIDREIDFAFYVSLGMVKTFKELTIPDYLSIVSNSPYGVRYSKGNISSGGVSAGNYNLGRIRSLKVPLPSLAEQQTIVDRVEKLLSMVDELEKQVSEREEQSEQLMQAVLREAFEGGKCD